jgi:putative aminopeptidase FrvX
MLIAVLLYLGNQLFHAMELVHAIYFVATVTEDVDQTV